MIFIIWAVCVYLAIKFVTSVLAKEELANKLD